MNAAMRERIERAFAVLEREGWIVQLGPDETGEVCRAFDRDPDAAGYVAVVHPLVGDEVVVEVGRGRADDEEDARAAAMVAGRLVAVGLDATSGGVLVRVREAAR